MHNWVWDGGGRGGGGVEPEVGTADGLLPSLLALRHVHTVVAAVDWVHSLTTAESGQTMQGGKPVSPLGYTGYTDQACHPAMMQVGH